MEVIAELKREVDMYMNSYMKEEVKGKDKGGLFGLSCAEVAEMEGRKWNQTIKSNSFIVLNQTTK